MTKTYNAPVVANVYLGSGKTGERLRTNINKKLKPRESVSEFILNHLRKSDPTLFEGVDNGHKK